MATMSASVSGVSLATRIAASTYLRGLAAVERGDFDHVLRQFQVATTGRSARRPVTDVAEWP